MGKPDVTKVSLLLLVLYFPVISHLQLMRYSSQASVRSVLAIPTHGGWRLKLDAISLMDGKRVTARSLRV